MLIADELGGMRRDCLAHECLNLRIHVLTQRVVIRVDFGTLRFFDLLVSAAKRGATLPATVRSARAFYFFLGNEESIKLISQFYLISRGPHLTAVT